MASRLLNVLAKLENDRQSGIRLLKSLDVPIDDDATIANMVTAMSNVAILDNDTLVNIPGLHEYTKDTDPAVWRRPDGVPNMRNIVKQNPTVQTKNNSNADVTAIAIFACLLKNDENNTVKFYNSSAGSNTSINSGDIYTTSKISYNGYEETKVIVTSDGTSYTEKQSDSNTYFEHTWDQSKDIIVGNDHYRWFIVYLYDNKPTGAQYANWNHSGIDVSCLKVFEFYLCSYRGITGSCFFPEVMDSFVIDVPPIERPGSTGSISPYKRPYASSSYAKCRSLEDYRESSGSWSYIYSNYLIGDVTTSSISPNFSASISRSVIYQKAKAFTGGDTHIEAAGFNRIRYLEITDPETQQQTDVGALTDLPLLTTENFFEHVTKLNANVVQNPDISVIARLKMNHGVLSFPRLKEIASRYSNFSFNELDCITLDMPLLEGAMPNFTGIQVKKITVPKITSITAANYFNADLLYLDASGVTSITAATMYGSTRDSNLLYLDVSSLEQLTNAAYFNNAERLITLVLKDGFKFNLNISQLHNLTKECVLDILNKTATLNDESYTLTLSSHIKSQLTSEEIAIATNKGWTVN